MACQTRKRGAGIHDGQAGDAAVDDVRLLPQRRGQGGGRCEEEEAGQAVEVRQGLLAARPVRPRPREEESAAADAAAGSGGAVVSSEGEGCGVGEMVE